MNKEQTKKENTSAYFGANSVRVLFMSPNTQTTINILYSQFFSFEPLFPLLFVLDSGKKKKLRVRENRPLVTYLLLAFPCD
jgi:hypothetical protein